MEPTELVTGYIYGVADKGKFLHSWVECGKEGKEIVMDYTMNVGMKKDGYYFLMHAEPIARISDKDVKEDIRRFGHFFDFSNYTQYLLFRDETIRQLEEKEKELAR